MLNKINALLNSSGADCALLRTDGDKIDSNFYYLSQISKTSKLSSFLILRKNKKPLLITTVLEYGGLKGNKNFDVICYKGAKDFSSIVRKQLKGKIGINYSYYTLSSFNKLKKVFPEKKFIDISSELTKLRGIKTKEEIKNIFEACRITEEVLVKVQDTVKVGMTEKELADELEYLAKKGGVENVSFPTIVAVGKNSSVPHHITWKTKIVTGKILLVDFGVIYNGYCSDLTRMFFIGRSNENIRRTYSVVYKAQREAIKKIRENVKSSEVFNIANGILEKRLGQKLIHSLGHGLGIDVHDYPSRMSEKSAFVLKENMCLTVEPAYYGRNFGIRIEDDVVVKKNGCRLLSDAPRELVEIYVS